MAEARQGKRHPAVATILLTCEHGGNRIPPRYLPKFKGQRARLDSHQGFDIGALACARALRGALDAPLLYSEISRLLIDLNRSPHHRALFSDITRGLPDQDKNEILGRYYRPHRRRVEQWIRSRMRNGNTVLHLAIHSFTPVFNKVRRKADIGLLYDPARALESCLCRAWQAVLQDTSDLLVRRNYPYRGIDDGLTRYLRARFPDGRYVGVELEINQRLLTGEKKQCAALYAHLANGLKRVIEQDMKMTIRSQNRAVRCR